jgi:hypothetical protein
MAWKRIWHKKVGKEDSLFAVERTSSEAEARERWKEYKRKGENWDDFVAHKRHQFFYDTVNSGIFTNRKVAINAEKKLFKGK